MLINQHKHCSEHGHTPHHSPVSLLIALIHQTQAERQSRDLFLLRRICPQSLCSGVAVVLQDVVPLI